MDTTTGIKPKSMAELLPGLSGILTKNGMQTLTAKKQPRQTIVNTRTNEKIKPLTIAEMRADLLSLRVQSPRRLAPAATSSKKKNWNSSVKVDKTVSHTANGKMKHNPVRKVLNFQPPKPKPVSNIRATMALESPKFTRPEFRTKKPLFVFQARTNVRISGINNIAETPVVNKPIKSRMTLVNKENVSNQPSIKKFIPPPKPFIKKKLIPIIPDTPMSNESWKSSSDASFLQREKEINDTEGNVKAIAEEPTLENIAAVTPPASTPFKEYRNVQEYFKHSSELESSVVYHDNTIMSFEKPADTKEKNNREENVIVSLCELLVKASVANSGKMSTELEDLLQIEQNLKMIDISIAALNKIKQSQMSQLTSLMHVRKLIKNKKSGECGDKTLTDTKETQVIKTEKFTPERKAVVSKPCSVIKSCSKSPSYKIPKKNLCLRKKVVCKSMPNIANEQITPVKADMGNKALSMYMKMKEHMNFLSTPVAKRESRVPDTPAVTSHKLQKQLDKLYDEN